MCSKTHCKIIKNDTPSYFTVLVFCLITRASGKNKTHETFHRSWVQISALSKRFKSRNMLDKNSDVSCSLRSRRKV